MPQYVTFPGVQQVVAASYTLSHGISPGVATIDMAPQANLIAQGGPLVFTDGNNQIVIPDCKVDQASLERNAGGRVVRLAILDRRWKWRFPTISGHYNLRHPSGDLIDDGTAAPQIIWKTVKTPQELAAMCLDAMGESGYDVSALPNGTFPAVEWEYANAAQELATLADDLGCRVVLRLNGTVQLWPVGFGGPLPVSDRRIDYSGSIDPPERPDRVAVVTGRIRHQVDMVLEAVGHETDGTIKPIDELSYRPGADPTLYAAANLPAGWDDIDLHQFLNIFESTKRKLAQESVFHWYRPRVPFDIKVLRIGGGTDTWTINDLAEIELTDTQVDEFLDAGVKRTRPAIVWGVWSDGGTGFENTATQQQTISDLALPDDFTLRSVYLDGFSIDPRRGLVKFGKQVFQYSATNKPQPATLTIRTGVYIRQPDDRSWRRYSRDRSYGNQYGTGTQVIKRDDLLPYVITNYNAAGAISGDASNQGQIEIAADHYLDAAELQYSIASPESATYAGIWPIDLDGAIQQVSWSISGGGLTTRASRNNEPAGRGKSYPERRLLENIKRDLRNKKSPEGRFVSGDKFDV